MAPSQFSSQYHTHDHLVGTCIDYFLFRCKKVLGCSIPYAPNPGGGGGGGEIINILLHSVHPNSQSQYLNLSIKYLQPMYSKISHSAKYKIQGSTWVKNEVQHSHFKNCRSPTWGFIKTVESDVKVL